MKEQDYSSNRWGYIDKYNPGLGDYAKIKDILIAKCSNKSTLDLGCLDGKWSEVIIKNASSLTLVDLGDDLLPLLKKKLGDEFNFYKTKGNELSGVDENSIDLIFSMDSLVRVPNKSYISDYFSEFNRVLRSGGELFIHLPCHEIYGSKIAGFTKLSFEDIRILCELNNFKIIDLNKKILEHGIMLSAIKNN
jgi:ubiquinone/menaquinone biosynthesis C-methylase UbiE